MIKKLLTKQETGFTLLEVVAALTIVTVILIPLIGYFAQASFATKENQSRTVASYAARNALVYVEKLPFSDSNPESITQFLADKTTLSANDCSELSLFFSDITEGECENIFQPTLNNVPYYVNITFTEEESSLDPYLIPLKIEVYRHADLGGKAIATISGHIIHEDLRYK